VRHRTCRSSRPARLSERRSPARERSVGLRRCSSWTRCRAGRTASRSRAPGSTARRSAAHVPLRRLNAMVATMHSGRGGLGEGLRGSPVQQHQHAGAQQRKQLSGPGQPRFGGPPSRGRRRSGPGRRSRPRSSAAASGRRPSAWQHMSGVCGCAQTGIQRRRPSRRRRLEAFSDGQATGTLASRRSTLQTRAYPNPWNSPARAGSCGGGLRPTLTGRATDPAKIRAGGGEPETGHIATQRRSC
jgi:hypothetical protein